MKRKFYVGSLIALLVWGQGIQAMSQQRNSAAQHPARGDEAQASNVEAGRERGESHTTLAAARTLRDVRLSTDGGLTAIIELDGEAQFSAFTLANPPRIVVDLKGVRHAMRPEIKLDGESGQLARVRVGQFQKDLTRVVFDLTAPQRYRIETDGPRLFVYFGDWPVSSVQGSRLKTESLPTPPTAAVPSAVTPPGNAAADAASGPAQPGTQSKAEAQSRTEAQPPASAVAVETAPVKTEAAPAVSAAESAAEEQRRHALDVQAKKISLLIRDRRTAEAQGALDEMLKADARDDYAHGAAGELFAELGDYVAAEHHLKRAQELAREAKSRAGYELKLVEINYRREKLVKELLAGVTKFVDEVNYAEAARAIQGLDRLTVYDTEAYVLRGGLLGVYRHYEDAVKIYSRVLEDPALEAAGRARVTELRDYCAEQATATPATSAGAGRCHFCKATLTPKAAYCHVCLTFQPQFAALKAKRETTSFSYDAKGLASVNYRYYHGHGGGNAFRSLFGGVMAAGGGAVPIELRDEDEITRDFTFSYEDGAPQAVSFDSKATVGGSTTIVAQSIGGVATTTKTAREQATAQAFALNERLVYANHPKLDAAFALKAFGQNVYRGFAGNRNFSPFWWQEPHIFVLYYDRDGRVSQAIDSYHYGEENAAGHRVVTGRKPFTGPDRTDPLADRSIYTVRYNDEGLVAVIALTEGGQESYRREISYGPQGIVEEREYFSSAKKPRVTRYAWNGGKLVSAKHGGDGYDSVTATFK